MRNTMWVAGLALATGCAMFGGSQESKKSETRTAQEQAHQTLQQAADAQKKAADEQAKVEKLQQEVTQKQKELADAQARLKAQIVKAQQAQRDAEEANRRAQQAAQQQQRAASQTQRTETQQMQSTNQERLQTWTQDKTISGRVLNASGDKIEVRTPDQGALGLKITDSTAVRVNGKTASVAEIPPGADVRASYQVVDGEAKALTIDATSKASGQ
jgi:multidrug efflux pump subunit AcrA (membrane-fusion protein)